MGVCLQAVVEQGCEGKEGGGGSTIPEDLVLVRARVHAEGTDKS